MLYWLAVNKASCPTHQPSRVLSKTKKSVLPMWLSLVPPISSFSPMRSRDGAVNGLVAHSLRVSSSPRPPQQCLRTTSVIKRFAEIVVFKLTPSMNLCARGGPKPVGQQVSSHKYCVLTKFFAASPLCFQQRLKNLRKFLASVNPSPSKWEHEFLMPSKMVSINRAFDAPRLGQQTFLL